MYFHFQSLSPFKILEQSYDGCSNMKGKINGLKIVIMKDSPSTYYIHCLAHQLQLILVAIAKKYLDIKDFFDHVGNVLNILEDLSSAETYSVITKPKR